MRQELLKSAISSLANSGAAIARSLRCDLELRLGVLKNEIIDVTVLFRIEGRAAPAVPCLLGLKGRDVSRVKRLKVASAADEGLVSQRPQQIKDQTEIRIVPLFDLTYQERFILLEQSACALERFQFKPFYIDLDEIDRASAGDPTRKKFIERYDFNRLACSSGELADGVVDAQGRGLPSNVARSGSKDRKCAGSGSDGGSNYRDVAAGNQFREIAPVLPPRLERKNLLGLARQYPGIGSNGGADVHCYVDAAGR